jgi:hypothetical protein
LGKEASGSLRGGIGAVKPVRQTLYPDRGNKIWTGLTSVVEDIPFASTAVAETNETPSFRARHADDERPRDEMQSDVEESAIDG